MESGATPGSLQIAVELAAHDIVLVSVRMALQHLHLLVDQVVGRAADRRLHRQQQQDVEQMVLDHVADAADLVIEAAAAFDAEILGHGDLHAFDEIAVPDRLEEGIGEAEIEQVLDRLLAEIVVDAEDRLSRRRPDAAPG